MKHNSCVHFSFISESKLFLFIYYSQRFVNRRIFSFCLFFNRLSGSDQGFESLPEGLVFFNGIGV